MPRFKAQLDFSLFDLTDYHTVVDLGDICAWSAVYFAERGHVESELTFEERYRIIVNDPEVSCGSIKEYALDAIKRGHQTTAYALGYILREVSQYPLPKCVKFVFKENAIFTTFTEGCEVTILTRNGEYYVTRHKVTEMGKYKMLIAHYFPREVQRDYPFSRIISDMMYWGSAFEYDHEEL